MKKPELEEVQVDVPSREWFVKVRLILQTLTGRRTNKITTPAFPIATCAGSAPTKAEFDRLAAQVVEMRDAFAALVRRFDE